MKKRQHMRFAGLLLCIVLLISSCSEERIPIRVGDTLTNYGNQFRILNVQRYSFPYAAGEYTAYADFVVIIMQWSCTNTECVTGGSEFILTRDGVGGTISGVDVLTDLSGFSLPSDSHRC